jgi:hypothetical protein
MAPLPSRDVLSFLRNVIRRGDIAQELASGNLLAVAIVRLLVTLSRRRIGRRAASFTRLQAQSRSHRFVGPDHAPPRQSHLETIAQEHLATVVLDCTVVSYAFLLNLLEDVETATGPYLGNDGADIR